MAKLSIGQYRHAVAVLKKAGLIDKHIDARKVKPTPALSRQINKFNDVISGNAKVIDRSKVKGLSREEIMRSGARIVKPKGEKERVIISVGHKESVSIDTGRIKRTLPNGVERISIPVKYHNLDQYLNDLDKIGPKLTAEKGVEGWFSFRFMSNNSTRSFRTIHQLVDFFSRYESVVEAIEDDDSEDMQDVYMGLEIVKIPEGGAGSFTRDRPVTRKDRREKDKKYRASLTGDALKKYKEKAAKRAARSRAARSRKK